MDLDLLASQAVYDAKLLEKLVHSTGPWEMRLVGITVPAFRDPEFVEGGVRLTATFFKVTIDAGTYRLDLLHRGEVVKSKDAYFASPEFQAMVEIEWLFTVTDPAQV